MFSQGWDFHNKKCFKKEHKLLREMNSEYQTIVLSLYVWLWNVDTSSRFGN